MSLCNIFLFVRYFEMAQKEDKLIYPPGVRDITEDISTDDLVRRLKVSLLFGCFYMEHFDKHFSVKI